MNEQVEVSAEEGNPLLKDITIHGHDFEVEVPYEEGHQLTAKEASQLNQVYLENIGNNFRNKVKELLEGGATVDAIQAELDKYASEYEFGARRSNGGTGGTRKSSDPVAREMKALAKKAVTEFFRKKDVVFADLTPEERETAIKTYLERHGDKVRVIAERRVADAADMAASGL